MEDFVSTPTYATNSVVVIVVAIVVFIIIAAVVRRRVRTRSPFLRYVLGRDFKRITSEDRPELIAYRKLPHEGRCGWEVTVQFSPPRTDPNTDGKVNNWNAGYAEAQLESYGPGINTVRGKARVWSRKLSGTVEAKSKVDGTLIIDGKFHRPSGCECRPHVNGWVVLRAWGEAKTRLRNSRWFFPLSKKLPFGRNPEAVASAGLRHEFLPKDCGYEYEVGTSVGAGVKDEEILSWLQQMGGIINKVKQLDPNLKIPDISLPSIKIVEAEHASFDTEPKRKGFTCNQDFFKIIIDSVSAVKVKAKGPGSMATAQTFVSAEVESLIATCVDSTCGCDDVSISGLKFTGS
ncbi:MAG: hypothetical protein G01um101413_641 [Parcubacteria group bacterium Gr01-1014_13]|nr:MAG: hypothetical protein G01um101413_641 [Parcubacteria group bacterium Gr01-1014_13]